MVMVILLVGGIGVLMAGGIVGAFVQRQDAEDWFKDYKE
jgi:hypothetical protein